MKRALLHIWRRLTACFLAGVLAILPLVITVAIVIWMVTFLEDYLGPSTLLGGYLTGLGLTLKEDSATPYILGWAIVLFMVFALGLIVEFGAKAVLSRVVDRLFKRIPLVGSIYTTSRQVVQMLDSKDDDALKGMSAVFCFFGKEPGTAVLAFLVSPDKFRIGETDYHIVIIPTAPVPFGGAMVFVPVHNIRPADMSVDGLMSIYLSMGVSAKQHIDK